MNDLTHNLKKEAIETIANGYIRIPRAIVDGMYSSNLLTRQTNTILHALLVMSSHSGRIIECKRDKIYCSKGEVYINIPILSLLTGIKKWTIKRILDKLQTDGFIETQPQKRGLLIRVIHYQEFTSARKNKKSQPLPPSPLSMDGKTPEQVAYEQAILEKRRQEMNYSNP